jgi:hypothetical protein
VFKEPNATVTLSNVFMWLEVQTVKESSAISMLRYSHPLLAMRHFNLTEDVKRCNQSVVSMFKFNLPYICCTGTVCSHYIVSCLKNFEPVYNFF